MFINSRYASDKKGETVFGLFIALWATVFLENWKRQQATLAMHWGMEGTEALPYPALPSSHECSSRHLAG